MVRNSDFIIAYVNVGWGGAARALEYAVRRKKPYLNFGQKKYE